MAVIICMPMSALIPAQAGIQELNRERISVSASIVTRNGYAWQAASAGSLLGHLAGGAEGGKTAVTEGRKATSLDGRKATSSDGRKTTSSDGRKATSSDGRKATASETELPDENLDIQENEAGDFEEMMDWLGRHSRIGGSLRLTADVTAEGYSSVGGRRFGSPKITVDTGEYSIIVRGELDLEDPNVEFAGDGGEDGIFHVEAGGILWINDSAGISAREGYAVYQEEGAFFACGEKKAPVRGEVHTAEDPAALANIGAVLGRYILVEPEEDGPQKVLEELPEREDATVCSDGKFLDIPQGLEVDWDLDAVREALDNRERTVIYGEFLPFAPDGGGIDGGKEENRVYTLTRPFYTVAFRDYPAAFLSVETVRDHSGRVRVRGLHTLPGYACTVTPLLSRDEGETWEALEDEKTGYDPDETEGMLALVLEDTGSLSLCLEIRREEEAEGNAAGSVAGYSDVLQWNGEELSHGRDIEGNRGGGTEIGGGLPPVEGEPPVIPPVEGESEEPEIKPEEPGLGAGTETQKPEGESPGTEQNPPGIEVPGTDPKPQPDGSSSNSNGISSSSGSSGRRNSHSRIWPEPISQPQPFLETGPQEETGHQVETGRQEETGPQKGEIEEGMFPIGKTSGGEAELEAGKSPGGDRAGGGGTGGNAEAEKSLSGKNEKEETVSGFAAVPEPAMEFEPAAVAETRPQKSVSVPKAVQIAAGLLLLAGIFGVVLWERPLRYLKNLLRRLLSGK